LHEVLLSALPDGLVRLGKNCVAIEQDSKGVKIKFQDGESARAGLLIGERSCRYLLGTVLRLCFPWNAGSSARPAPG